jgi:hypothetical protein
VDVIRTPPLEMTTTQSAALLGAPQRPSMPARQGAKLLHRIAILASLARELSRSARLPGSLRRSIN